MVNIIAIDKITFILLLALMLLVGLIFGIIVRYPYHFLKMLFIRFIKRKQAIPVIFITKRDTVVFDVVEPQSDSFTWNNKQYWLKGNPTWIQGLGAGYIYYEGCSFPIITEPEYLEELKKSQITMKIDNEEVKYAPVHFHIHDPNSVRFLVNALASYFMRSSFLKTQQLFKLMLVLVGLAIGISALAFIYNVNILDKVNAIGQLTVQTLDLLKTLGGMK